MENLLRIFGLNFINSASFLLLGKENMFTAVQYLILTKDRPAVNLAGTKLPSPAIKRTLWGWQERSYAELPSLVESREQKQT
jgi:hypothetical protein